MERLRPEIDTRVLRYGAEGVCRVTNFYGQMYITRDQNTSSASKN